MPAPSCSGSGLGERSAGRLDPLLAEKSTASLPFLGRGFVSRPPSGEGSTFGTFAGLGTLSNAKFSAGRSSSSSSSKCVPMGDQSPRLPVRPRWDGRVAAKDVTPLPTVMPPVLTANESRGTVPSLLGLFRRPLSPALAGEILFMGPLSFQEKVFTEVEKDECRPRIPFGPVGVDDRCEVGVATGDRRWSVLAKSLRS